MAINASKSVVFLDNDPKIVATFRQQVSENSTEQPEPRFTGADFGVTQ